ncbi:MAG: hypothetical protein OJJ21_15110 [Ferrovibrio sp.]|uniref:hypothetical protein n=1 Tax=Ferrovibrio sp. TaxID=1917215 RepID=UPI002638A416|nr:hypothetical protein [Ferrovibrio sp.]MCW0234928.1 hypothetical protein [Ferrovibrio sp.]
MMLSKKTIVILPRHSTSWAEMLPIAQRIRDTDQLHSLIVLANDYTAARKHILETEQLPFVDLYSEIATRMSATAGVAAWLLAHIKDRVENSPRFANWLPVAMLRMIELRRQLGVERDIFRNFLHSCQAKAVLLPGDRELSPVPSMLRACRDEHVPTLIAATNLPYSGGLEVTRLNDPGHQSELHRGAPLLSVLAAWLHPKQTLRSSYGRLLFSPGWRTFALALENMLPEQPWIQGGGLSDFILQHNRSKLMEYLRQGLSDSKVVGIGDVTLDPLHRNLFRKEALRKELSGRYGIADGRPLVVMAVPNEAEHDLCDWPTHLQRQESFWSKIARHDATVLLSLHPKSERKNYQALADRCGFHFADERLHDILPAADLFVCSCSTTCLWAKLCAVPVLNMDYLGLRLDYFREPCGVFEVYTPDECAAVLPIALAYTRSPQMLDLRQQAARIAQDTIFDGKAMDRLMRFVELLASGEPVSGPLIPEAWRTKDASQHPTGKLLHPHYG